jgi:hypothetical protein
VFADIDPQTFCLTADSIRINYKTNEAFASGHIVLTRPGLRVLADSAVYHDTTKEIEVTDFRLGRPPLHVTGRRAHGTAEVMHFEDVTLTYAERLAPRGRWPHPSQGQRMEAHMLWPDGVVLLFAMTVVAQDRFRSWSGNRAPA